MNLPVTAKRRSGLLVGRLPGISHDSIQLLTARYKKDPFKGNGEHLYLGYAYLKLLCSVCRVLKTPLTLASSPYPDIMDLDDSKLEARTSSLQIPIENEKLNHRSRRRNRMRASCLNCYASKRKCDKRRPCGRCMRLGTTGLCIYEVEDTVTRNETDVNELKRLRLRIAELESVIRELKNNPHPRWTAPGGVVQDPNFFDSYRRSTQKERRAAFGSPSAASLGFTVKSEESTLCAPEVKGAGDVSTPGAIHGSSQVPFNSREPAAPISLDPETVSPRARIRATAMSSTPSRGSHYEPSHDIMNRYPSSKSTARMSHIAASEDTVTVSNSSAADSSDCVSSLSALQCSDGAVSHARVTELNDVVEVAREPSLPQPHISPSSDKNSDPCNCLKAPMAFGPLVRLGISLRTSREVLDHLHPFPSNCMLYYRITVLEQHIFSVPPQEQSFESNPSPGPCKDSFSPTLQSTVYPHSPSKNAHECLLQHDLYQSTPASSSTHQYPHMTPRSPEPFGYMSDTSACRSLPTVIPATSHSH